MTRARALAALAALMLLSGLATTLAMRRTSTTFDEIVMIAGGARGYETGDWSIAPEHPPFTQYMYGLLPFLAGMNYPNESAVSEEYKRQMGYRYHYAQRFFWQEDNDPERLTFLGRLPAVLCAMLLVLSAFLFMRRRYGYAAGVTAALMVAFLPDMLAHGGVAYNDVPIALAFFLATWALDSAIRQPTVARALLAGLAAAIALGIKNSAIGLGPLALLLLLVEAATRGRDLQWWKRVSTAAVVAIGVAYLALVAVYRGDFALAEYRYALSFVFDQVSATRAPAYLLGEVSSEGIWYYFPVAFLFKTSAALHVLLLLGVLYAATRLRSLRQVLVSPLRAPVLGACVFGLMLATSQLHIGFRYALPMLVLVTVTAAPLVARIAVENWQRLRPLVLAALLWLVIHPLTYYPNFLAYVSEYGPGRDRGYQVLVDSSLDWGQGLLQLRDYMREHRIDRVYLSYFGSALPDGYGIDYAALPSFFPLSPRAGEQPQYVAISATNLAGAYFGDVDPFRNFRERQPEQVIGHTIYLFRIQ